MMLFVMTEKKDFMMYTPSFRRILTLIACAVMVLADVLFIATALAHAAPRQTEHSMSIQPKEKSAKAKPSLAPGRPVLAFYYMWYHRSDWSLSRMPDLPTIRYNSSDDATIDRQITWAANAGITGFISSWWGPGDPTDQNFTKLLAHSAKLEHKTHQHFASTVYFECDSPRLKSPGNIIRSLRYLSSHTSNNPYFFHWQGKPVFFFWKPLDQGRTLAQWAAIRQAVDPQHRMIWSAEGVDMNLLNVFDGIHLFSAGYWGLAHNNMPAVDQGFHDRIAAYSLMHHTHKIWAAGVEPGYDDTRLRRRFSYRLPRRNGALYTTSWMAAMASQPEWITITSFNEWFEGAMIEPGMTYGNQYLILTQRFIRQWRR
jgi:hypothetical protein